MEEEIRLQCKFFLLTTSKQILSLPKYLQVIIIVYYLLAILIDSFYSILYLLFYLTFVSKTC